MEQDKLQKNLKVLDIKLTLEVKVETIPVYPIDGGDGFDVELAKGGAMLQKQNGTFDVEAQR